MPDVPPSAVKDRSGAMFAFFSGLSLDDLVVLVVGESIAAPINIASGDAFVKGSGEEWYGWSIGIPVAVGAATFHWWKRKLPAPGREWVKRKSRWTPLLIVVAIIWAYGYVVAPDIYRRATAPLVVRTPFPTPPPELMMPPHKLDLIPLPPQPTHDPADMQKIQELQDELSVALADRDKWQSFEQKRSRRDALHSTIPTLKDVLANYQKDTDTALNMFKGCAAQDCIMNAKMNFAVAEHSKYDISKISSDIGTTPPKPDDLCNRDMAAPFPEEDEMKLPSTDKYTYRKLKASASCFEKNTLGIIDAATREATALSTQIDDIRRLPSVSGK